MKMRTHVQQVSSQPAAAPRGHCHYLQKARARVMAHTKENSRHWQRQRSIAAFTFTSNAKGKPINGT
jgi:hypothetical protein